MAVPVGLGLDYVYNRRYLYPGHPAPEMEMGRVGRGLYRAGRGISEHPATGLVAGGITGAVGAQALRTLLRRGR